MNKTKSEKKVMLINAQHDEECRAVILNNNVIDDYIVEHSSREQIKGNVYLGVINRVEPCLLYTSPSPRDGLLSRMPSPA